MKRILVICRNLKSLSTIAPESDTYYIVASDAVKLHDIAIQYHWVNEVCWLEQMESFFNVAEDVKSTVDIINEWLHSLSTDNCIPAELLFWIRHAEGGMTTQRIQDALLLIRSYLHLIENTNPSSILIASYKGAAWENDILIKIADSMNIPVKVVGKRHKDVKLFLKLFAREPYYISKFLHSKLSTIRKSKNREKEIVFQLCTAENKHLAHTTPLMKSLFCRGYEPIVLCWGSPKCAIKVREMGLNAEYLEKYGSFSSIITGDVKLINTWKSARKNKNIFLNNPLLQYKNVPLGDILWPSIQFFFSNSVAQRYRFLTAIKKYYTRHSPVAIRFWTMTMPEGTIALRNLPQSQHPIVFGNTGFHDLLDNPYLSKNELLGLDLKLVTGDRQKEKDEEYTLPKNRISVIGHVSWEHYSNSTLNKKESLKKLSIDHQYSNCILYDAGVFLRGFLSIQEQVETATALLDFAEDNPEIALLIKPHPNHKSGILDIIIKDYGLTNVYLIDKSKSIFDCINVADLLITKWSTVGIEAMYMNTPVISVCLDKERKFAIYGDAAHYIYEIEDLRALLNHKAFTPQWKEDLNRRAVSFLSENFYQPEHMTPSQIGADEIISML